MEYVYIKQNIDGHYAKFAQPLDENLYNNIGTTWEDYLANKWVMLSDEQVAFMNEHPDASVSEVWNMKVSRKERLAKAKAEKIAEIEAYDQSPEVNSFSIGGVTMWLTVEQREQIATQISASESIGRDTMTRWFGGVEFTYPLAVWKQMLVSLEVYAGDALNVTEAHKAAVNAMTAISEIEAFDITAGYPDKLEF